MQIRSTPDCVLP